MGVPTGRHNLRNQHPCRAALVGTASAQIRQGVSNGPHAAALGQGINAISERRPQGGDLPGRSHHRDRSPYESIRRRRINRRKIWRDGSANPHRRYTIHPILPSARRGAAALVPAHHAEHSTASEREPAFRFVRPRAATSGRAYAVRPDERHDVRNQQLPADSVLRLTRRAQSTRRQTPRAGGRQAKTTHL